MRCIYIICSVRVHSSRDKKYICHHKNASNKSVCIFFPEFCEFKKCFHHEYLQFKDFPEQVILSCAFDIIERKYVGLQNTGLLSLS